MKKRWITILLTLVATLCLCLGMAACADKNPPETETWTIEQVYARAQELGFEGTLEELIAQFKGEDGKDGKDGIGIKQMYINTDGELIVVLTEGDPVNLGTVRGKDGKDGKDGKSAFDIWKETYGDENSTEEDFLEWLRGSSESTEEGLQYTLNPDNKTYSVTDIGTYNKIDLIIPAQHAGMPVTEIAENVFRDNQWIRSVTISATIKKIGMDAFEYCPYLTKVVISDLAAWCNIDFDGYNSNPLYCATHLYLGDAEPHTLDIPAGVVEIKPYAFIGCLDTSAGRSELTSITIPDSVTSIGNAAFNGCSAEIVWGEHPAIKEIGEGAFRGYEGTSFTIPDGVTSIGEFAFSGCGRLTSLVIPASVTSVADSAFYFCNFESITVAGGNPKYHSDGDCLIETATHNLLLGCNTSVIPKDGSVTAIGDYAFIGYCGTSIVIPDSVTSIGELAFAYCSGLTSLVLPANITSIGDYAFAYCTVLTSLALPASLTSIGEAAFAYCYGLASITVADENPKYHSDGNCLIETATHTLLSGCNTSVIPQDGSVTSIGNYAFAGCVELTSIVIPDSVTSIGIYAFQYCVGLTSVEFKNPNGWYVSTDPSATSGTALSGLDDKSTAPSYLREGYVEYYWKRNVE